MVAVGRCHEPLPGASHQVFFAHQAQHPLVVDADALSLQFVLDAAVAIARPVQCHLLSLFAQRSISLCRFWGRQAAVVTGTGDARHLAQVCERSALCRSFSDGSAYCPASMRYCS